jgi:glycolate oxidase
MSRLNVFSEYIQLKHYPEGSSLNESKQTRLIELVGNAGVFDDPESGESFSLDHKLILPRKPSLLVKPRDVEDIQKIVLWANETLTPLMPVSSGGLHFHGDRIPTALDSVIIDLSGMKRILKINRRNRLALIEPGVTHSQLQPEL